MNFKNQLVMVSANELRVGNKVLYDTDDGKEICTIDGTDISIIQNKPSYAKDHYPIELTPDVLIKCGFVHDDEEDRLNLWYKGQLQWVQKEPPQRNYVMVYGYPVASIHYLHQLQNLYFALTQKELEIKL